VTSFAPEVPIRVDPETGIWTTDGLPMVYLPRHFYVNHHDVFAAAFGRDAYAKSLYEAGYKSAWQWCEKESVKHQLRGGAVFLHYMKRISQRGWGRFTVEEFDATTGFGRVRLDHSIYVCHHGSHSGTGICYAFAGWFPGSLEWVGNDLGLMWNLIASETQCAADGIHDHCIFSVRALHREGCERSGHSGS
jgi:predicted hydrocarbon binding protein